MFESSVAVFGESRSGLSVFMRRGTWRHGTWVFGLADLVLATVVELEVFGSWVFGDGSRTRVREDLAHPSPSRFLVVLASRCGT